MNKSEELELYKWNNERIKYSGNIREISQQDYKTEYGFIQYPFVSSVFI